MAALCLFYFAYSILLFRFHLDIGLHFIPYPFDTKTLLFFSMETLARENMFAQQSKHSTNCIYSFSRVAFLFRNQQFPPLTKFGLNSAVFGVAATHHIYYGRPALCVLHPHRRCTNYWSGCKWTYLFCNFCINEQIYIIHIFRSDDRRETHWNAALPRSGRGSRTRIVQATHNC